MNTIYKEAKSDEMPIQDHKKRTLIKGDLVVLIYSVGLNDEDVIHKEGDIMQFIGGLDDNLGRFMHCNQQKMTEIFADRTLLINKI